MEGTKMFEVGKRYRFRMWEPGPDGGKITVYPNTHIKEVNLPLVTVSNPGAPDVIVNTASISFVDAREADQA
jgi:hypothetical protein